MYELLPVETCNLGEWLNEHAYVWLVRMSHLDKHHQPAEITFHRYRSSPTKHRHIFRQLKESKTAKDAMYMHAATGFEKRSRQSVIEARITYTELGEYNEYLESTA